MADFMVRFLFCNILVSIILLVFVVIKRLSRKFLTSRMQYNLWFLFLLLLFFPLIRLRPMRFQYLLSFSKSLSNVPAFSNNQTVMNSSTIHTANSSDWMNDLTLSVNQKAPSTTGIILFAIWIIGIFIMTFFMIKSKIHIYKLRKTALPLQNKEICNIYNYCLSEMHIKTQIPIYRAEYIKSPIIVGFLKPCIYLPTHVILDCSITDIRFMLLHELQHYKYKDAFSNYLMNLACIFYWFNPLIWYALKLIRNEREIACDSSVLQMLGEESYLAYGNTLINFAEKISFHPFLFSTGISSSMKQMKLRIVNIASYKTPTITKKLIGSTIFMLTTLLLFLSTPLISTYATEKNYYKWDVSDKNISYKDFSNYFGDYKGSFVLYDLENDSYDIYNLNYAKKRIAPNSTFKIYDALIGLEAGIISPENSFMKWNGNSYPFDEWNTDQTLQSAMKSSVNWYFESIDEQLSKKVIYSTVHHLKYGNEDISGGISSYWLQSSLKISPIEQVEILKKFYNYELNFSPKNIDAVKNSIFISSSENGNLYGKTGTGQVNGNDVNGWFVGYIESTNHTYFFATNIRDDKNSTGKKAAEITLSILSDINILK